MEKDINLLTPTELSFKQGSESDFKNRKINIIFLILFLIFIGAVFFYLFFLNKELNKFARQTVDFEKQVDQYKDKEYIYRVLKMKLSYATDVLNKRPNLIPVLDLLENTTPKGIVVTVINVPFENKISLAGTAQNPLVLEEFFNNLTEKEEFKKNFIEIKLNSLVKDKSEIYKFDLLLVIK